MDERPCRRCLTSGVAFSDISHKPSYPGGDREPGPTPTTATSPLVHTYTSTSSAWRKQVSRRSPTRRAPAGPPTGERAGVP